MYASTSTFMPICGAFQKFNSKNGNRKKKNLNKSNLNTRCEIGREMWREGV